MQYSNSNNKTILIATFSPKSSIDWVLKIINDKYGVSKDKVFVYEIKGDDELMLTFKINKNMDINFKNKLINTTVVNTKNECIFSINGLNKLIETQTNCDFGNIDYKKYSIDWSLYKNKLILMNKKELKIKDIKKIDIKTEKNKE